jgi:hypothetical protein
MKQLTNFAVRYIANIQIPHYRPVVIPTQVQNRLGFCMKALNGAINCAADVNHHCRIQIYHERRFAPIVGSQEAFSRGSNSGET